MATKRLESEEKIPRLMTAQEICDDYDEKDDQNDYYLCQIAAQLADLNANLRHIFQVDSKERGEKTPRLMIDSLE